MKKLLVFTDLDGSLIDHDTYDFKAARPALDQLRSRGIPVIICSSKTRAEIEVYRGRMGLNTPFITENGGAILIPHHALDLTGTDFVHKGPYDVVELGMPYADLRTIWEDIRQGEGFRMKGFSEMTVEEIATHSGLTFEEARLAARREYSEPFMFSDTPEQFERLTGLLKEKELRTTRGGRFYHLIGENDKGRAVRILSQIYSETYTDRTIQTIGLGDSDNDIPMLRHVDVPIVIRKKTGEWQRIQELDPVYSDKAGPEGWAEEILALL
ncbi:MAG: HAD-IIB family hydrolase [Deltaproteobacteria bacterium]|nr:HAD-IIB family hydrolase [Deltaproteobacteria bacterium]